MQRSPRTPRHEPPTTHDMASMTMRDRLRRAGQFAVYLLVCCVIGVLRVLPLAVVWRAGAALGWLASFAAGRYFRLAVGNLRIAFGREKDEAWLRKTARGHFASLGANLMCGFKLPLMDEREIIQHVRVEGIENTRQAVAEGRSVIFAIMRQESAFQAKVVSKANARGLRSTGPACRRCRR